CLPSGQQGISGIGGSADGPVGDGRRKNVGKCPARLGRANEERRMKDSGNPKRRRKSRSRKTIGSHDRKPVIELMEGRVLLSATAADLSTFTLDIVPANYANAAVPTSVDYSSGISSDVIPATSSARYWLLQPADKGDGGYTNVPSN